MPTDTFATFAHRVEGMTREISGPQLAGIMVKTGMQAKNLAREAASADLGGDPKFSGWAPTLDVRFRPVGVGKLHVGPTRRSAGPWTVAEFGRHSAEGPPSPGLTKSGKKSKAKGRRWNGRTQGKQTASEAVRLIERDTPQLVEAEFKRALRRHFD